MVFNVSKVEEILGIKIKNEETFKTAFTHRSYLNEHPSYNNPSNERLEFLGDAVLQLLSSEFLYKTYTKSPEGDLTNFRSAVVCTSSIAEEAKKLGYGAYLLLSNGEETTGGREREYILANTFEAVLGALYLEEGIDFCREFLAKNLFYKVRDLVQKQEYKDAKSQFQELAQEKYGVTPAYEVLDSWGPDHEKTFKVGVYVDKKLMGIGEGRSKQKAEQQAALSAIEHLKEVE